MTKKSRREYKQANQQRKARIMHMARTADPRDRGYWAATIGTIQDGKYTKRHPNAELRRRERE